MLRIKSEILFALCKTINKPIILKKIYYSKIINVKSSEINGIGNTTFNILELNNNKKKYYFREIKLHEKFKKYVLNSLNDYFLYFNKDEEISSKKDIIIENFITPKTLKKLYWMGTYNDSKSLTATFFRTEKLELFKLEKLQYLNIAEIKKIIKYIMGDIFSYRLNNGVPKNAYQTYCSSKIISFSKLAEILGVSEIVPQTEVIKLIIDNKYVKYGTLMNEALGVDTMSISLDSRKNITPNFQRTCSNLNVLDTIAHDKDHRPDNYKVVLSNGKIDSINVFDNDSPMSFFVTSRINMSSYMKSTPFVDKNNIIYLDHLDKNTANKILKVKKIDINEHFKYSLSRLQKFCLYLRIKKIKKAIMISEKNKPNFLIENCQWNNDTINEEINANSINSYLHIFLKYIHK